MVWGHGSRYNDRVSRPIFIYATKVVVLSITGQFPQKTQLWELAPGIIITKQPATFKTISDKIRDKSDEQQPATNHDWYSSLDDHDTQQNFACDTFALYPEVLDTENKHLLFIEIFYPLEKIYQQICLQPSTTQVCCRVGNYPDRQPLHMWYLQKNQNIPPTTRSLANHLLISSRILKHENVAAK